MSIPENTSALTGADIEAAAAAETYGLWLAVALGALAVSFVAAIYFLSRTQPGDAGKRAFMNATVLLCTTALLALMAAVAAAPSGGWRDVELITRQDWFRNNFEFLLVAGAIAVAIGASLYLRAWANVEDEARARIRRNETTIRATLVAGCAIGASVLAALGASAFSASLWQRQVAASISESPRVSLARIQATVDRITYLNEQIGETDLAVDRYARRSAELFLQANEMVVRTTRLRAEAQAAASEERTALDHQATLLLIQAEEAHRLGEVAKTRSLELDLELDRLELRRECNVFQIAQLIADDYRETYRPTVPRAAPGPDPECRSGEPDVPLQDWIEAALLVETVQTLTRSWMSSQMATRAPIALSIELILLMGALGALLEAAGRALFKGNRSDEIWRNDRTLVSLGLTIIFGMSTALVFFVLLNATIVATTTPPIEDLSAADFYNPFALALVGLAGGYSSHQVIGWLSTIVDQKRGQDSANAHDDQTSGDGAPPS